MIMMKTLRIEDSGWQTEWITHYTCVRVTRTVADTLISWLPRAQLSLSKELFQLETHHLLLWHLAKYTSLGYTI